jgi:membrane-associated phospholipid phosphatase
MGSAPTAGLIGQTASWRQRLENSDTFMDRAGRTTVGPARHRAARHRAARHVSGPIPFDVQVERSHVAWMLCRRTRASTCTWVALGLALAVSCVGGEARADDVTTPNGSPYRLRLPYDLAFLGLGTAGSLTAFIGYPPTTCPQPCIPPQSQLGIDDAVAGNRSSTSMIAANVLLGATLAAPVILDAIDSRFHGWAEDMVIVIESLALSTALTQVVKSAAGRLAPLVYSPNVTAGDLANADAARSFPSGHTAGAFSVTTAYAITFWKRHPDNPWRIVVAVAGGALSLTTGILTITAGWHYPTDVAVGALTGLSVGVLMPVLHADW